MEAKLKRSQTTQLHSAKFITLSVDSLTKALAGRVLSIQCMWKSAWSMKVEIDKSVSRVIYVRNTGWMVRVLSSQCMLRSVWSGSRRGEVCVDVRMRVFLDWRAVSTLTRAFSCIPQSVCRRGIFVCFYFFSILGVCVCLWEMVWCGVYILFFVFFLFFLLLLLLCISHSPITVVFLNFCTFLGRIGMHCISMAYCYRCSLVCLLDTAVSHAKTDKLIKMPFGLC